MQVFNPIYPQPAAHLQFRFNAALLLLILLSACDRLVTSPERTATSMGLIGADRVPPRVDPWQSASSEALWAEIARFDSTAMVGIKAPNAARGVYEGVWLIDRAGRDAAIAALRAIRGVTIKEIDGKLPLVRVAISSVGTLQHLREVAYIDYVEPALLRAPAAATASTTMGPVLSSSSGSSSSTYGSYLDPANNRIPNIYPKMRIPEAWALSTGAGLKIGLVDTGVDTSNPELAAWQTFVAGDDGGSLSDLNGHGTHMAGVIGAPRNGVYIVGVAYGASFASAKHSNNYLDVPASRINAAMDSVIAHGARIVNFSFRGENSSNAVSDRLSMYYNQYNVLFVAAAGTGGGGTQLTYLDQVYFPASDPHVIAVAAVSHDSYAPDPESHYGDEVELSAPQGQPTTGTADEGYYNASTSGTSNSSALVSGIAALTWSRYPHLTNAQVRTRLRVGAMDLGATGRDPHFGYGMVNAYAAVGGFWASTLTGANWHDTCTATTDPNRTCYVNYEAMFCFDETFRVIPYGDGPFTYRWSTGSTSDQTTTTLCPTSSYDYTLQVTVTDGLQNKSMSHTAYIRVDGGGTADCDPNLDPLCPM